MGVLFAILIIAGIVAAFFFILSLGGRSEGDWAREQSKEGAKAMGVITIYWVAGGILGLLFLGLLLVIAG